MANVSFFNVLGEKIAVKDIEARERASKSEFSYKNKKIILVGDSYLERENSYLINLKKYLPDITFFSFPSSGGGFTIRGNHGTFLEALKTFNGNKNDITDIIVLGGTNDVYGTISELENAIKAFFSYCKSNFVNAIYHIGFLSNIKRTTLNDANFLSVLDRYLTTPCGARIVHTEQLLRLPEMINLNDGVHPTDKGQDQISRYLASYILNGNSYVYSRTYTPAVTSDKISDLAFFEWQTGDTMHFVASNPFHIFSFGDPRTILCNGSNYIELWTEPDSCLWGRSIGDVTNLSYIPIECYFNNTTNNTNEKISCYLSPKGNVMRLIPFALNSPSEFKTVTYTTIQMQRISFEISAI